jgi:hypothetical protein
VTISWCLHWPATSQYSSCRTAQHKMFLSFKMLCNFETLDPNYRCSCWNYFTQETIMEIILLYQKEKREQPLTFLLTWHKSGSKYGTKHVKPHTKFNNFVEILSLYLYIMQYVIAIYQQGLCRLICNITHCQSPSVDTAMPSLSLNRQTDGNQTAELAS